MFTAFIGFLALCVGGLIGFWIADERYAVAMRRMQSECERVSRLHAQAPRKTTGPDYRAKG